ncbi:response regulator transcription factor [Streptomyces sp. AC512_CC834]|uniref:response regulator transcription factor n=1 Tax=Streptomyces sp. AC512_CC834 TaxID=2823691 RepID=UPI0020B78523|nr:LuxR C-terminal-related transcriptional regulator [Streptomyces sp. AC512_CC834]
MSRASRPTSEGRFSALGSERTVTDLAVPRATSSLTPRERQVLDGIKEGNSNRMVARLLGISERTVKVHLHSIFIKLGAASRTEAVIEGIRSGCITLH